MNEITGSIYCVGSKSFREIVKKLKALKVNTPWCGDDVQSIYYIECDKKSTVLQRKDKCLAKYFDGEEASPDDFYIYWADRLCPKKQPFKQLNGSGSKYKIVL